MGWDRLGRVQVWDRMDGKGRRDVVSDSTCRKPDATTPADRHEAGMLTDPRQRWIPDGDFCVHETSPLVLALGSRRSFVNPRVGPKPGFFPFPKPAALV